MSTKNADQPDAGRPVTPVSTMSRISAARAARLEAHRRRLDAQQRLAAQQAQAAQAAGRARPGDTSSAQIPSEGWPRWMTVATCADYIDRSHWAIRGLMKRGKIPFLRRDGVIYFDRVVIDQWMQGTYRPAARCRRS